MDTVLYLDSNKSINLKDNGINLHINNVPGYYTDLMLKANSYFQSKANRKNFKQMVFFMLPCAFASINPDQELVLNKKLEKMDDFVLAAAKECIRLTHYNIPYRVIAEFLMVLVPVNMITLRTKLRELIDKIEIENKRC